MRTRSVDLSITAPPRRVPTTAAVRAEIDRFLELAATFGDSRSATGGQLEQLRTGAKPTPPGAVHAKGDENLWRRTQVAEERQHRYAILLLVWQRCSAFQQQVLMAQRTPIGLSDRVVQIRQGDLEEWMRRGAEWVGTRKKYRGKEILADDDCVFVSEPMPLYPTREKIAEMLGATVDQVRRAASAANDIWLEHMTGGAE